MENNEIINVQMTKEVFETLGSGGNGGGNQLIYKDVRSIDVTSMDRNLIYLYRTAVNANMHITNKYSEQTDGVLVTPPFLMEVMVNLGLQIEKVRYIALDLNMEIVGELNGYPQKLSVFLEQVGLIDILDSLPTITEEQFYDLTLSTE